MAGRNMLARSADISGALILTNKYGQEIAPSQDNLSSDFVLVYVPEEELNG